MPKVSVVIPVYNVEKYLGECLDSVLRQTLDDIEIICVDDGSTDGSSAILVEYAAKDPRIRVITQSNAGLSAARNVGMDAASGKYIYFLDSDDYITDNAMARCVEICERDNLDQLVFGCSFLFEDPAMDEETRFRKSKYFRVPGELTGHVHHGPALLAKMNEVKHYCVAVPLRLFRLESLRSANLRFGIGLLHEDVLFTPLSLIEAKRVEMIVDKFYVRRYRPGSIVTKAGSRAEALRFVSRLKIYDMLKAEFFARGYLSRFPELATMVLRCERSRLVNLAVFPVVCHVVWSRPVAVLSLWLHNVARKARRFLCPKK